MILLTDPFLIDRPLSLQAQEDFFAVEKMAEPDATAQADQGNDQIAETGGDGLVQKSFHVAAGQSQSQAVEADNVVGNVNGKRVHPDPNERLAPFLIFPDIDHQVE